MAHIGDPERALLKKKTNKNGHFYAKTQRGSAVLEQVAAYVTECLDRMEAGVVPSKEMWEGLPIRWFNR